MLVHEEVLGICKRFDAVGALRHENVVDVLTGRTLCTNSMFKDMFTHLKQCAALDNLHILQGINHHYLSTLDKIKIILDKAFAQYDSLCISGLWNRTNRGGRALWD